MNNNEEHATNSREQLAQQENKRRIVRDHPTLNNSQRIEFLELVAQMASRSVFERKLSLTPTDIEFYKKELDVESFDEARSLARKLRIQHNKNYETKTEDKTREIREAHDIAQARLEELERKTMSEKMSKVTLKIDINKVRQEDADRQRLFEEQKNSIKIKCAEWNLPIQDDAGSREEQIDRFRRDIMSRGFNFINKKYGSSPTQTKIEAERLGLSINWDVVRK